MTRPEKMKKNTQKRMDIQTTSTTTHLTIYQKASCEYQKTLRVMGWWSYARRETDWRTKLPALKWMRLPFESDSRLSGYNMKRTYADILLRECRSSPDQAIPSE